MKPPIENITAPPFPKETDWVNVASLRMDQQIGRPVLVEFWDFCRVNSLRTMPYMKAWHERYTEAGLRVIGIHSPGFKASSDPAAVREAVERLGIEYAVAVDSDLALWQWYGNEGWPARYLWNENGLLRYYHYGEGDYHGVERAIQEQLGIEEELTPFVRPEDEPDVLLPEQSSDVNGAYSGPYEAGGVWGVFDGRGAVLANGEPITVDGPGCYPLIEHSHHTSGVLELEVPETIKCEATCFTPGLADESN